MDQQYSNFIEIKYEALFDSLKKCEQLEHQKMLIGDKEYDSYPMSRVIDVLEDTSKPRYYRPKSPPSDEYIKENISKYFMRLKSLSKIKKNLKEFGDLKIF